MDSTSRHLWCIFQGDKLLLCLNNTQLTVDAQQATLPFEEDIQQIKPHLNYIHALGITQYPLYCGALPPESHLEPLLMPHYTWVPLRKAFELLDAMWFSIVGKAYSVVTWDCNHQFCGRCGGKTIRKIGLFERVCPICTLSFYPRISPSIIVLIHKEDHILMARSPHFLPGVYGLIAGFVEPGETLEEAVHREVKEEVNLTIHSLRYMASQAWPFPDSLMAGFFADYASGDILIDNHEIEDAGWYRYDALPSRSLTRISIARKLIDQFIFEVTHEK